jgi:hypothetical protein
MPIAIEIKKKMKNQVIVALAGILMLAAVFIFQYDILENSSPVVLLILVVSGFVVSLKYKLPGGIFLFSGGMSLAVYPLLFSSSYWLLPGGILTGYSGLMMLIHWWQQNEN